MNEQTVTLLNEISKNAEMGKNSVRQLLDITADDKLRGHLHLQLETYEDLSRRAHAMLSVEGETAKEQSPVSKMSAKMGIAMQTIRDKSTRNLAEMLIEGNQMGVTDMVKAVEDAPEANIGAIALAQRLQDAETRYVEELQSFL